MEIELGFLQEQPVLLCTGPSFHPKCEFLNEQSLVSLSVSLNSVPIWKQNTHLHQVPVSGPSIHDLQAVSFWVLQFTLLFGLSLYLGIAGLLCMKVYWELALRSSSLSQNSGRTACSPSGILPGSSLALEPRRGSRYPPDETGSSCHELGCGRQKPCLRFGPVS